jgi:hypothetical protein
MNQAKHTMRYILALIVTTLATGAQATAADKLPPGVVCLLEDNAADLLPKLTNPWGDPGEGHVEKDVVFSGDSSVKITVLQRYCNFIPGWAYRITEKPKDGEYRFLRFAWKSDGLTGIMVQLHDDKDWHIRYTSGANKFGWTSKTVGESLPAEWQLVTIDLFKDFGEREIHGIALTTFDGTAGYFDHIYLGRSVAELDSIDATSLREGGPLKLSDEELEKHWKLLSSADGVLAYRSFWTLAAAGETAQAFVTKKLGGETAVVDEAKIQEWLKQLDDDDFATRERATSRLITHFAAARKLVEAELKRTPSAEVRTRLEMILKSSERELGEAERVAQKASRILNIIVERAKK